jgi:hypothetical protein
MDPAPLHDRHDGSHETAETYQGDRGVKEMTGGNEDDHRLNPTHPLPGGNHTMRSPRGSIWNGAPQATGLAGNVIGRGDGEPGRKQTRNMGVALFFDRPLSIT